MGVGSTLEVEKTQVQVQGGCSGNTEGFGAEADRRAERVGRSWDAIGWFAGKAEPPTRQSPLPLSPTSWLAFVLH